ncbi:related to Zn(II)Cys6 transcriptional activator [Phialocephala subalpina]|uniref:Related to Zn(II)Cys6 transcriptional activator n=1 Tax=Phialocephala subalpina TaxID=576137 RepID=A0A1L7WQL2_9HELO|nr:related to Zn(II)Cys6 transcriptional activator [Phialocephala subalpina]
MASLYGSPNGQALPEPQVPKAPQACMSCRKQKRKCSKTLPACALCDRMNRHCDYSDASPPPTSEDFNALQMKVMELESRLNGGGGGMMSQPSPYATPSSTALGGPDGSLLLCSLMARLSNMAGAYTKKSIGLLLTNSRIEVPKPSVEIPVDVLELLGDSGSIHGMTTEYFSTIHKWMPIVSQKRLQLNLRNPLFEGGPDLALLFLCMKLITSRPQDGVECSHNPIYTAAKRFVALTEASGSVSILILQANLLVTWYEYSQAIYPAAWMSAGWCLRYANMLGINGHDEASKLLGRPGTWVEQEERQRTWWGVLLADRITSLGSQGYIMNSQEPKKDDILPANDSAWDNGEMESAMERKVSNPIEDHIAPFPRLCQASVLLGKVLAHNFGFKLPLDQDQQLQKPRFIEAAMLYEEISALARVLHDETTQAADYLSIAAPLALTYSAMCALCDSYSCPKGCTAKTPEAAAMQAQAVSGLKTVSGFIVEFSNRINANTPNAHDLDRVSPIIMDALYSGASNYAWLVRESGDESSQQALDAIRYSLRRLGTRWRNAAEYLRLLDAREFTYAVGSVTGS